MLTVYTQSLSKRSPIAKSLNMKWNYSSPKSFMRKIGLRLRSVNDIRWLSEASHNSFRIAIVDRNI
ncbi:MAG: hypothetical protein WCP16_21375 [Pseudanabaena sp. ELA645]